MNYKKILSLLLAASMAVSMPINVFATQPITEEKSVQETVIPYGVPDYTPPVLHSLTANKDSVKAGETLELTLNITDDISGIDTIIVTFLNEKTQKTDRITIGDFSVNEDNNYILNYTVPSEEAAGILRIDEIYLSDVLGNSVWYSSSKNQNREPLLPNEISVEVLQDNVGDIEAPKLNDLSLKTNSVSAPGETTLYLTVSDDVSGVDSAQVIFINRQTGQEIEAWTYSSAELMKDNVLEAKIEISEYDSSGIYELNEVYLSDKNGHSRYYYSVNSGWQNVDMLPKEISFTVENGGSEDITPPVLNQISINKTEVVAPGSVVLTLDVIDDVSGFESSIVDVVNRRNGRRIHQSHSKYDNPYQIEIPISEFEPSGVFEVDAIYVFDKNGNMGIYYSSNSGVIDDYPVLPNEISFFVKNIDENDQSGDIITSTNNPFLAEEINQMEEGSTAHIYYGNGASLSKDVFEAIKGQDKTISLESAGIEWIFNGQDIEDENIKDIDLTTDINLSWNSDSEAAQEIPWDQNAIVLSFADNGTLPAPAKIRIKMDYAFKDSVGTDNLYVYYYDNTNKEFVQVAANLVITDDDYLEFTITHNSDFVITDGELKKKEPENPDPTPTPDPTPSNPDKGTSSNSSSSSSSAVNYESEKPNPADKKAVEAYNFWQNAKAKVRTTPDGKTMRLFVPKDITYMPASMMETLYREKITLIITHNGKKIVIPAGKAMPKQKLKVYWTFESLEKLYQA